MWPIVEDRFDVCSAVKFALSDARFSRICRVDPVFRLIGNQHLIDDNGYLGVSVSHLEALWIAKVLRGSGINACPVAERYKNSTISADEAMQLAKIVVAQKRAQRPDFEYEDPQEVPVSWWLSKIAFSYFSKSEKMKREGFSPAGITVCIDRASGLVMGERELSNAELQIMLTE